MVSITEPGLYEIPAEEYHTDPTPNGSLSASTAKYLLPPYTPADYHWQRTHRPAGNRAFDFGHLAHKVILGEGNEVEVVHKLTRSKERVPAGSLDTVSASEDAQRIRSEGKIPVLEGDMEIVEAMAAQVHAHPEAHALLTQGKAEQSAFVIDPGTGLWRRGMFDILPEPTGRPIIPDYKTTKDTADPGQFNRRIGDYGYHRQAAQYRFLYRALFDIDPAFVFVVQSKTPPYLVSVIEPDTEWLDIGDDQMDIALARLKRCLETDQWPGYPGVHPVTPPAWVANSHDDLMTSQETAA